MRLALILLTLVLTIPAPLAQGNGNGQGRPDTTESQGPGNGNGNGNGKGNGNSGAEQGSSDAPAEGDAEAETSSASEPPAPAVEGPVEVPVEGAGVVHHPPDIAVDAVGDGRAVGLASLLPDLEARGAGEVIDAELLSVSGFLVYAVKTLRTTGQVTTEYYYAQSGRFIGTTP